MLSMHDSKKYDRVWRTWHRVGRIVWPLKVVVFWLIARTNRKNRPRVAIMTDTHILLIKNWGENAWALPGGGQSRKESKETAAQREVREELGVSIPAGELELVATVSLPYYDASLFRWNIAVAHMKNFVIKPQKLEISDYRWFRFESLPILTREAEQLIAMTASVRRGDFQS